MESIKDDLCAKRSGWSSGVGCRMTIKGELLTGHCPFNTFMGSLPAKLRYPYLP
jgi:hypothetical protein